MGGELPVVHNVSQNEEYTTLMAPMISRIKDSSCDLFFVS
jgi:hypothetical protein